MIERRDPRIRFHPMCKLKHWMRRAIPISVHADAVPCVAVGKHGTRSFEVHSWQSILGKGGNKLLKQYFFGIFTHSMAKDTMAECWEVLIWSFKALFAGAWPSQSHKGSDFSAESSDRHLAGTPLAGSSSDDTFFCVIWSLKGDWDYFLKGLNLRGYNCNLLCDSCCADKGHADPGMLPSNLSKRPVWKTTLLNSEAWRALYGATLHQLFVAFSFLSNANVDPDELHVLHIGTTMYFLGSVLWLLVYRLMPGSAAANMARIWSLVSEFYSEHAVPTQFSNLTLSSFCQPDKHAADYPRLKGRGAEVKHLTKPLWSIWDKFRRPDNEEDDRVGFAFQHLCEIHDILDEYSHDFFLPPDAADSLLHSVEEHLFQYGFLAHAADVRGDLLFTVAPKHHMMYHWGAKAKFLNPRRTACFIDEDYVKIIKGIVRACTAGRELHQIAASVTDKHRWGLHMQYKHRI